MNDLFTNEKHYLTLDNYLKHLYHEKVFKVSLNGNFSCPNRDGTISTGGCIFCSERGSGEHIKSANNISEQIQNYFKTYRAERANKFIVYFQNFTNLFFNTAI